MGAQTHGVNSSKWWEGKLKSAEVNNYKCEGIIWYHEAARCSFLSINTHCAPARVFKKISYINWKYSRMVTPV